MKYGLLVAYTANLGDDIQSLAALQFYPRVDVLLHREFLSRVHTDDHIKVVINGWFMHLPQNFPPSTDIEPLFISFHIAPNVAQKVLSRKGINYLKRFEPIGARDLYTEKLLKNVGIESYFSGCLTLTLDYKLGFLKNKDKEKIVIVDLHDKALKALPKKILEDSVIMSHALFIPPFIDRKLLHIIDFIYAKMKYLFGPDTFRPINDFFTFLRSKIIYMWIRRGAKISIYERLVKALIHVSIYANAKLIITSRIHAALPAISFGVPTIFVHPNLNDPRFSGLLEFLNHYSIAEFKREAKEIDFENPPDNPKRKELQELKKQLIKTVEAFIHTQTDTELGP